MSHKGKMYDSRSCANKAINNGAKSAAKRGDILRGRGEGKAPYTKRGGMTEHRYVAEQMLGRKLLPGETIHHIDGDKKNNDPSNLAVLTADSEHKREHNRINALIRWGKLPRDIPHLDAHEALVAFLEE